MTEKKTPSDLICESEGINDVEELLEILEQPDNYKRTLHNWSKNRPKLLQAAVLGAAEIKRRNASSIKPS